MTAVDLETLSSDTTMVTLGDIATATSLKAGTESNLPVYAVTKHRGFVPSAEYFSKQVFSRDTSGYKLVRRGEFAYATIHLDEGSIGIAPEDSLVSPMYTSFAVNELIVDPTYLFLYLKSPRAMATYPKLGKGSAERRKSIPFTRLKELPVPLPSLNEQRRIAAIFDKADELRSKRRQAIVKLEELQDAVVAASLRAALPESSEIPFHELAAPERGTFVNGPFGSDLLTSELTAHGVPVIYIRDISSRDYKRVSSVCVSNQKAQELRVCGVEPGDVLIAKVGDPPGTAAVYPADEEYAIVTQDVIRIKPNPSMATSEFIVAYLNSSVGRHRIREITVQATRARIGLGNLKKMYITVPPIEVQRCITEKVSMLVALKQNYRAALRNHEALITSLQQRAFRGEL